jgi:hypothetical protein
MFADRKCFILRQNPFTRQSKPAARRVAGHVAATQTVLMRSDARGTLPTAAGCRFWNDLGGYAKAAGLEWGGEWHKKDVARVQMKIIDSVPSGSVAV